MAEALAAILAERIAQFANGHTVEADRAASPRDLQRVALKYLNYGIEDEQFARPLWRDRAHRHYAAAAAALLALMLRLPDANAPEDSEEEEHPTDAT